MIVSDHVNIERVCENLSFVHFFCFFDIIIGSISGYTFFKINFVQIEADVWCENGGGA